MFYVAGIVAAVATIGIAVADWVIDWDGYKPQIAGIVQRATGRVVTIGGPIGMSLGFIPTITLEDVSLANVPGGSRPAMVTAGQIEADIDLLSLLSSRVKLVEVRIVKPDILLETDANGAANWLLTPEPAVADDAAPKAGAAAQAASAAGSGRFALGKVRVEAMRIAWRDARRGRSAAWDVPRLEAKPEQIGGSMLLSGKLVSGGRGLLLSGEIGALSRLLDPDASLPWSIDVSAKTEGFRISVRGAITHALRDSDYKLTADVAASDITPILPLLAAPLPELRDGTMVASVSKKAGAAPVLSSMNLHVIGLTVPSVAPGVSIRRGEILAPGPEQPVSADVDLISNNMPVHLSGTVGLLSSLTQDATPARPVPVELGADAAGALMTVKGTARLPRALSGLDLVVVGRAANLAALAPLVGFPLPEWKQVGIEATVEGLLAQGGTLKMRRVAAVFPEGDISGDLAVTLSTRPSVRGSLKAARINMDELRARLSSFPSAAKPPPGKVGQAPAAIPKAAPKPAALFSTDPIELAWLGRADLDLKLGIAKLQNNGVGYGNIASRVVLDAGKLTADPLTGDAPGGRVDGRISLDSRADPPSLSMWLRAPSVTLAAVASLFGDSDVVSGMGFIEADLQAAGRSAHALAASATGHIGLTLTDGDIDNALLAPADSVFKSAHVPDGLLSGLGRSKLRCLAGRVEIAKGEATVTTLMGDTPRLLVEASGMLHLGPETLALRLRPVLRPVLRPGNTAAPAAVVVPVRVEGALADLKVTPEPMPDAPAAPVPAPPARGTLRPAPVGAPAPVVEKMPDPCPPALASVQGLPPAAVISTPSATAPAGPAAGTLAKPAVPPLNLLH